MFSLICSYCYFLHSVCSASPWETTTNVLYTCSNNHLLLNDYGVYVSLSSSHLFYDGFFLSVTFAAVVL